MLQNAVIVLVRSDVSRGGTVRRAALVLAAAGIAATLVGCASSPELTNRKDVRSFSVKENRYTVYYEASIPPGRAKQSFLNAVKRENASAVTATPTSTGTLVQADADREKSEQDGEVSGSDETPGFEEFEDSYGSSKKGEKSDVYDPLEGYNRFMFQVNDTIYVYVLKPTAQGWRFIGPEPVRKAIDRFFENTFFPIRFVNSVLQLEMEGAGRELGRFTVNTTVGIGGLFDPAKHWIGWTPNEEDFGQTLGRWGVGPGFPLVLPIVGPSNLRDTAGLLPDGYLSPMSYIEPFGIQLATRAFYRVNVASLRILGVYDRRKEEAIDPYTLFRNMYRQNRASEVKK